MKFAHLGDCHLGGWRQPELKELNFECFKEAMDRILKEKVDFILLAGDLFDSPYPPIETLKETFEVFKKIKEATWFNSRACSCRYLYRRNKSK